MNRPPKKRVAVDQPQTGLNAALNDVLSQFDTSTLPKGEMRMNDEISTKKGRVVLRRETAHRGGKTVVIVSDFASHITDEVIHDLGRKLRKQCGCGGTVVDREIEIQGELVPRVRQLLEAEGFRVDGVR